MNRRTAFTLVELLVVVAIVSLLMSMLLPSLKQARNAAQASVCLSNERQLAVIMMMYTSSNRDHYPPGNIPVPAPGEVISWDDLLSDYDGRNLSYEAKATRWLYHANRTHQAAAAELYRCPSAPPRYPTNTAAVVRTYDLVRGGREHVSGVVTARGIGHSEWSVRTVQVPAPSQQLLLAPKLMDGAPGYMGYWSWLDHPMHQATSGEPLHDGARKWNYLFADSHAETLDPMATIGNGLAGPDERAAGGFWTRKTGD